eukprot:1191121-Prymnesium_polylepis.1
MTHERRPAGRILDGARQGHAARQVAAPALGRAKANKRRGEVSGDHIIHQLYLPWWRDWQLPQDRLRPILKVLSDRLFGHADGSANQIQRLREVSQHACESPADADRVELGPQNLLQRIAARCVDRIERLRNAATCSSGVVQQRAARQSGVHFVDSAAQCHLPQGLDELLQVPLELNAFRDCSARVAQCAVDPLVDRLGGCDWRVELIKDRSAAEHERVVA